MVCCKNVFSLFFRGYLLPPGHGDFARFQFIVWASLSQLTRFLKCSLDANDICYLPTAISLCPRVAKKKKKKKKKRFKSYSKNFLMVLKVMWVSHHLHVLFKVVWSNLDLIFLSAQNLYASLGRNCLNLLVINYEITHTENKIYQGTLHESVYLYLQHFWMSALLNVTIVFVFLNHRRVFVCFLVSVIMGSTRMEGLSGLGWEISNLGSLFLGLFSRLGLLPSRTSLKISSSITTRVIVMFSWR